MTRYLAGCIITDADKKVLLIHRNTERLAQWELPGGKIEADEKPAEAAAREVLEEISLKVSDLAAVGTTEFDDNGTHWHYTWFVPGHVDGQPVLLEPATFDDLKFIDLTSPPPITLSPNVEAIITELKNKQLQL